MASAEKPSPPGRPHIRIEFEDCALDETIEAAWRLIPAVGDIADRLYESNIGNGFFDVSVIDDEGDPVHFEPERPTASEE